MITLSWYLLKVIICSGILCGYYFLALRNKVFHRWNRFYLLAAVVVSLLAPVIKISIFNNNNEKGSVVQMLQTISYGDEAVIEYSRNSGFQLNTENVAEGAYLLICLIFLAIFFVSLFKIKRLRKKYPETKIEDISFINTNAKGTPFSFFKSIFWNNAIDLHSRSGQQIFNHEIAHVKEKHSYDKIFMNIVLIFFWINPFFWLMRKELYMIHEFIADKEALEDSDINAFAEMILQTVYPGQNFSFTNNFFYAPIKRRIMMLTKNKNPKVNYISRLFVLPLAGLVFFAFTLKVNSVNEINSYNGKTITVVIDAGHGGDDNGASANDLKEKDITLSIAKKIAALNSNDHIDILLSRDNDQSISVKDRVHFAKNHNANLFVSIHLNSAVNQQINGFSVLVDRNNSEKNRLLASSLINELKSTYKTADEIEIRNRGLVVLDSNACPSVVVECGNINNSRDAGFISNSADQEKVARNILNGIENYASALINNSQSTTVIENEARDQKDSLPATIYYQHKKVESINGLTDTSKIRLTFEDGSHLIITNKEALKSGLRLPPPAPVSLSKNALYIIDGQITTKQQLKNLNPMNIESINILKGDSAIKKYGEKGKNGVVEIIKKNDEYSVSGNADTLYISGSSSNPYSQNSKFTGNVVYINSKIPDDVLIFADGKEISKDEMKSISPNNIRSIDILKGESAIKKYGAKGKNGAIEITTKKSEDRKITQTYFTFEQNDSVPDKVFTKVETEASFPGGQSAWFKYISKAIQDSISTFTNADYGTCVLRFIVNTDGSVSDVIATKMKGTRLAEVSANAIKNGPNWIPASQNGHKVAAYRLQPVTLKNADLKPTENNQETPKFTPPKIVRDSGNVYVNPDGYPKFPGGQTAWLQYITRVINQHGTVLSSNKNNSGICKVKFVVNTNGKVSEVHPTTMAGTELAKVAVNAIKDGPDWIPGKQNGQAVNSFVIQPVTFYLGDQSVAVKGTTYKVVVSKDSLSH